MKPMPTMQVLTDSELLSRLNFACGWSLLLLDLSLSHASHRNAVRVHQVTAQVGCIGRAAQNDQTDKRISSLRCEGGMAPLAHRVVDGAQHSQVV